MGEWIRVEDRLPEDGVQVLIYSKLLRHDGLVEIVSPRRAIYHGDGHWTSLVSFDYKPTHWMPLPDPPEADDE